MRTNTEPTTDPTYTLARSSAGHQSVWTHGMELSDAAVVAHLNGHAAALREALRELAEARGHVEALAKAVARERTAQDAYIRAEGDADEPAWDAIADNYQDACASTIIAENAARAWLRVP